MLRLRKKTELFIALTGLFASKPAPTGVCISNVGAGLLAKGPEQPTSNQQTHPYCTN